MQGPVVHATGRQARDQLAAAVDHLGTQGTGRHGYTWYIAMLNHCEYSTPCFTHLDHAVPLAVPARQGVAHHVEVEGRHGDARHAPAAEWHTR